MRGKILILLAITVLAGFQVQAKAQSLGTAGDFAVLGGSRVTNTGASVVSGDLGVWPGSAITGFPPGIVVPPGTTHADNAVAEQAQSDLTTAYNSLAGMACNTNLTGQDLGGLTLTPGVYCFSSSAQLTGTLTLDAQGNGNALFVFQMGSTITTASNSSVLLTNGGQACNVFWQVGSSATLGTATAFVGNILALTSITLTTGADVSGRALARNGAVTMDTNKVSITCAPCLSDADCPPAVPVCETLTGLCGPCLTDGDCDDGLFCNGDETCVSGACQAGSDQCLPPQGCDEDVDVCAPCLLDEDCPPPAPFCDTSTEPSQCVLCLADVDCDDGLSCNGTETCVSAACQAGTPCPTPPTITHCPDPITLDRGDKICNDDVQEWLDSFTAESICGPVVLSNDAPPCGFPAGATTTVTFTATDECGLETACSSTITVEPLRRVTFDQKGSLLIFSKVEILWDSDGNLIQDTFLDVTNDYPGAVAVQAYYINGDIELEERTDDAGNVTQNFEPGWNTADCRFALTANQPHYWSAARGSDKCQPFTVVDAEGPGRPDAETDGATRILRGYVVMWAVEFNESENLWEEIRWNHLKGDAVIVNYQNGTAWEYNAWSAQATDCVAHGEPLLDCARFDDNGVCCEAEVIPGNLGLDGFQYDIAFDQLILDFYGSGADVFSGGGVTASVDTDLTVHAVDADLRQDGCGPVLTKIEAEIWNEFETKFSGTRRCICCWDQTMLSDWVRSEAIPNHFKRSALRTDKGKARLDGVYSTECDYEEICGPSAFQKKWSCGLNTPYSSWSQDAAILGLATKFIAFSGGLTDQATAGMNLVGAGREAGTIIWDVSKGDTEELRTPRQSPVREGSMERTEGVEKEGSPR